MKQWCPLYVFLYSYGEQLQHAITSLWVLYIEVTYLCNCWNLGMDKWFHPPLSWVCGYLCMLRLELIYVSKRWHQFLYSVNITEVLLQREDIALWYFTINLSRLVLLNWNNQQYLQYLVVKSERPICPLNKVQHQLSDNGKVGDYVMKTYDMWV